MSITYEEALATLQAMFEEPWTRDTLDAVLRHQKGHMENTVDIILKHGSRNPQLLIDQLDSGIDPDQSQQALDEQLARQLQAAASPTRQLVSGARAGQGIGTSTVLPDDFLRVPNFKPSITSSSGLPYSMNDDEALARMLQDELFTEELRRNPDFAHLAGSRRNMTGPAVASGAGSHRNIRQGATAATPAIPQLPNPFANFARTFSVGQQNQNSSNTAAPLPLNNVMDKLAEMGEGAKRRLQLMASQFQAANAARANSNNLNNSFSATSFIGGGNESPAAERRSLLRDDTDDMELAARKDL